MKRRVVLLLRYDLLTDSVRYTSETDQPSQLCESGWQILDTKRVQLYSTTIMPRNTLP
jgi:hypothetical protein